MLTRITHYNGDLYQISIILFEDNHYEIVEIIRIPLVGRPNLVQWHTLPTDLQEQITTVLRK